MSRVTRQDVERIFRDHYGRAVAVLARHCGNLDDAEEAVQDAFIEAVQRWPSTGFPPSPVGWIITTAKHRAIDRRRREASRPARHLAALQMQAMQSDEPEEESTVRDDQLRLIFTCCHPALSAEAQVALTLRLIGGLSTLEIARAFLVSDATMAQRLVRAKGKIRAAGIPYRIPDTDELPARLQSALAVVYLIFNEGYKASIGEGLMRESLCAEALRLGRLLVELMPNEPEVSGLLALMLLNQARQPARTGPQGELIVLAEQDRNLWNRELIAEGQALVRECVRRNQPGPYQLQAAISAVHSTAVDVHSTDWRAIVQLYDLLLSITANPIIALHRAVAVAEVDGPENALQLIEQSPLPEYYLYHAIRADFLRRVARIDDAKLAYESALALAENASERLFLQRRLAQLSTPTYLQWVREGVEKE